MMSLIGTWILVYIVISSSTLNVAESSVDSHPNIILMNMDDLGWGDLGITGHPARETPNLDKMASTGLLHTEFYAAAAICSPSRASLLTGRLPLRNGFYQNTYPGRNAYTPQEIVGGISDAELLIPELMQRAGYRTKIIGKWHLGHQEKYLPLNHGFDEWLGAPNCHFKYNVTWRKGPNIPIYRDKEMIGRYYENFEIDIAKGFSSYTEMLVDEAVAYIKRNSSQPYFLYWAPDSTHAPSYSSSDFSGKSVRDSYYGDAVMELDDGIGRILSAVKSTSKTTLVIFTSDNGAALVSKDIAGSNGPLLCGKQTTFEGGFRVPTISWWSNGGPRGVSHEAASHMDLLPTFAELVGVGLPDHLVLDGVSILLILQHNQPGSPKPIFFYRGNLLYALRFQQHKAHFYTWTTPDEELEKGIDFCPGVYMKNITTTYIKKQVPPVLFNLGRDPGEKYPLSWKSQEYKDAMDTIEHIVEEHRNSMEPGVPQLEICDEAVMNWSPRGCERLSACIPPPPSSPYKCFWPH